MMLRSLLYALLVLFPAKGLSQLLPSIGLNSLPPDGALICQEPFYTGGFYATGYQVGDTVPDFKLYDLQGDSLVLSEALGTGKPVLLIAGSLTCPVFRARVSTINQVKAIYGASIGVYVIYTLEAHPTDTSVYFGYVNITSQNISAGILFPQPVSYGERKAIADTMSSWVNLQVPVLLDGPCNNWWKNFGPAPNNSYLVGTDGTVLSKHGWFHKNPDNIFCDLDSILSLNSGSCSAVQMPPGTFSLSVINSTVAGETNSVLYDYADIINTSTTAVTVKMKKLKQYLPAGWASAFCADICYGITDDSVLVSIDAMDTLHFSLDFFSGPKADTASILVGFKNTGKPNNSFTVLLKASTVKDVSTTDIKEATAIQTDFILYPNPCIRRLSVLTGEIDFQINIYDPVGKWIYTSRNTKEIDVSFWPAGIYSAVLTLQGYSIPKKVVVLPAN